NGAFSGTTGDQLWRYRNGTWTQIDTSGGQTGGVGIFDVDPTNADRLYASNYDPAGPHMVSSSDGGDTWSIDADLDSLMTGGGAFKYQTLRGPTDFTGFGGYVQPTLVAFDPKDHN